MKEKIIFLAIALVMLVVIIGSSYAFLSTQSESNKNHIVKAGKLEISFSDVNDSKINLEGAYPIPDSEGMKGTPHTFTITNTGSLPASYQISLADNTTLYNSHNDTGKIFEENQLKLGITNGNGNTTYQLYKKGTFIEGTLDSGKSATYTIRMWIPEHIGNEVQGYHFHGNIKVDSVQTLGTKNQNITKIYAYNQETGSSTFCVTGEEDTCQEIKNAPATYEVGTIIKYKVNETEEKYFFVMQDNGDTLTLQQRENTINETKWYANSEDSTKGPTTVLSALEEETSGWNNVNDLTYRLGTTVFKDNYYTGCQFSDTANAFTCVKNTYSLGNMTTKVRMITIQEAYSFGCLGYKAGGVNDRTCPIWMYNYLTDATSSGGTVNDEAANHYGYWTLSTNSNASAVWYVLYHGRLGADKPTHNVVGARAVIEVNKLDKEAIETIPRNENILAIFQYDPTRGRGGSTFCVTGEELTCVPIRTPKTYTTGTIIKYKVNDSEEKYFFVVSDNGNTLTLQQRENIVTQTMWYTTNDNSKGPLTILPLLEEATSGWSNVLEQTYTLGTTVFKDNAYTGCSANDLTCTSNKYVLEERTARARMITAQEAFSLGCTSVSKTCPVWMYNYLSYSSTEGLESTENYGLDDGYWSMSANINETSTALRVNNNGNFSHSPLSFKRGARAVVVINK